MNPTLTAEQIREAQVAIVEQLKARQAQLEAIRQMNSSIVEKWQRLLLIILPIQLRVIKSYGFQDTQEALSNFLEQFMQHAENDPSLAELNKKKWLFMFEKAFGVTELKEISIEEARSLVRDIVSEMTSDLFLQKIDAVMGQLKEGASMMDKRTALLTILFPLQISIMVQHGFEGDKGYVQAQGALLDYYFDPMIRKGFAHAQSVVFERAHLL